MAVEYYDNDDDYKPEPITEVSLAETFSYLHMGGPERIRYAARLNRWLVDIRSPEIQTHGWQFDDSRMVQWLARKFLAQVACNMNHDPTIARRICTARMRTAIVDLARDTPDIAASSEEITEALSRETEPT